MNLDEVNRAEFAAAARPRRARAVTCRLLLVCTGNICRSPAAERLLASRLHPDIGVTSAGTRALVGSPISPPMAVRLESAGVDSTAFVARQLNDLLIRDADVVLALAREHRAAVVEVWPAAVRRTFTLAEFARLLRSVDLGCLDQLTPAQRLLAAVPLASAQRSQTEFDDDVCDPYRRSDVEYDAAFEQIDSAVTTVVSVIGRERAALELPSRGRPGTD